MPSPLLLLSLLLACGSVERGTVLVCLAQGAVAQGEGATVDGIVSAIDAGDCAWQVHVDDGSGTDSVLGFSVTDGDGAGLTPDVTLAVGDTVHIEAHERLVWGTVSGFSVTAADGLVVAADEGGWGGAFADEPIDGLSVELGEVVSHEAHECVPIEGHTLVFHGDTELSLTPIEEGSLDVGGVALTAQAVAAWGYGQGTSCAITDTTDVAAWTVYR